MRDLGESAAGLYQRFCKELLAEAATRSGSAATPSALSAQWERIQAMSTFVLSDGAEQRSAGRAVLLSYRVLAESTDHDGGTGREPGVVTSAANFAPVGGRPARHAGPSSSVASGPQEPRHAQTSRSRKDRVHSSSAHPSRLQVLHDLLSRPVHGRRRVGASRWVAPLVAAVTVLALVGGLLGGDLGGVLGASVRRGDAAADPVRQLPIMARMAEDQGGTKPIELPPASAPPEPAPPSLAAAPALKPHEIFGFAPYWTLPQAASFDLADLTTLSYFSVDVNSDGSVDTSGPGWAGYESQALADLVTRSHAAGDRVVLTVTCFDQGALDSLSSDPGAPGRLASQLESLIEAKNLDGVNLDFEGTGSSDRQGLDRLVSGVSSALKATDPNWQVTMDTYASAAGDPGGFYDIAGLAQSVDAFFVMGYDMNDRQVPSATAPLTGGSFSDSEALSEYTSVVSPSKVILGVPYYGYDWPTSGPALGASATGAPSPMSYSQIASSARQVYWDPSTQTPWTSYEVGGQWHQTFFDDATSLALKAQLAASFHIAGLGVWALGMDGDDPSMVAALLGNAPVVKDYQPSPEPTSNGGTPGGASTPGTSSPSATPTSPTPTSPTPTSPTPTSPSTATSPSTMPTSTTTTHPTTTTTTTTVPSSYRYSGSWNGMSFTLDRLTSGNALPVGSQVGLLYGFSTNDPSYSCLTSGPPLPVLSVSGRSGVYVAEATTPVFCVEGSWEFVSAAQDGSASTAAKTGQTTSAAGDPQPPTMSGRGESASYSLPVAGGFPSWPLAIGVSALAIGSLLRRVSRRKRPVPEASP
jgi:hypothetical protein